MTVLWTPSCDVHYRSAIHMAGLHFLISPIIFHLYSNFVTYWKTYHAYRILRVSTDDQHLDLQRDALTQVGCEHIYEDTVSGVQVEREGLTSLVNALILWSSGGWIAWVVH